MFSLRIPVTASALTQIKADLRNSLPEVKSSHRVEALARGLGFNTYAAIRSATRSCSVESGDANGAVFVNYLAEHDFNVGAQAFYRSIARIAVRISIEKMPELTAHGFGVGRPKRNANGEWESFAQRKMRFAESRAELFHDICIDEFLRALAFVQRIEAVKTVRENSSYGLKHMAENYDCTYPEGHKLGPNYVSNGALIAAALHAGFKYKNDVDSLGYASLNVAFNMSRRSLDIVLREIRSSRDRRYAA